MVDEPKIINVEVVKGDTELISKTNATAEVLKHLQKIKQLSIIGVIISFLVIIPSWLGDGTSFIIVGAGCIAFGYFYLNNEKEIKRLKEKYKL